MTFEKMQAQFERCKGPAPKPWVKPKPMTGIERERLVVLDAIGDEFLKEFKEER
jgi:hypothetical protein